MGKAKAPIPFFRKKCVKESKKEREMGGGREDVYTNIFGP